MRQLLGRLRRDGFNYSRSSQPSSYSGSQITRSATGDNTYAEQLLKPGDVRDAAGIQSETIWEGRSRSPSEPPIMQIDDAEEGNRDVRDYGPEDLGTEDDEDEEKFLIGDTARLSLYFCVLWVSNFHYTEPKKGKKRGISTNNRCSIWLVIDPW